jgi:hypothetical protein
MELKNRYLIALALVSILAVQTWLVYQNDARYQGSEDGKAELKKSKSDNERLAREVLSLRGIYFICDATLTCPAELQQFKYKLSKLENGSPELDHDMISIQSASLAKYLISSTISLTSHQMRKTIKTTS